VGNEDELPPALHTTDILDNGLKNEMVVEIVLRLVNHQWCVPSGKQQGKQCRALLSPRELRRIFKMRFELRRHVKFNANPIVDQHSFQLHRIDLIAKRVQDLPRSLLPESGLGFEFFHVVVLNHLGKILRAEPAQCGHDVLVVPDPSPLEPLGQQLLITEAIGVAQHTDPHLLASLHLEFLGNLRPEFRDPFTLQKISTFELLAFLQQSIELPLFGPQLSLILPKFDNSLLGHRSQLDRLTGREIPQLKSIEFCLLSGMDGCEPLPILVHHLRDRSQFVGGLS